MALNHPGASESENAIAMDNVTSSLGKLVMFKMDGQIVTIELLNKFLCSLPLTKDTEEATALHKILFKETLSKNQSLF